MADEETDGHVASWSAHHIPPGSRVRYVLDFDDEAPIRLIIGDREQVSLTMTPSTSASIVSELQDAQTRRAAVSP